MHFPVRRAQRLIASSLLVALTLSGCASLGIGGSAKPWLYKGSDVPVDTAWTFGTLPNGVRYAVRQNGAPPGQVSIRVRIDAGSLMETDAERGYAHFLEHLSFRGSKYVPDGEAKRVWQRLGATFGSDSNAQTTPTQTVYQLDLPGATPGGLQESMKILSGMMAGPVIDPATVDSERAIVLAEQREAFGPGVRVGDATRELLFAGQPLGDRPPIGTTASLKAATAAALKAFHDRWYRPDRTVVVVSGDGDPKAFEALVRENFSGWKNPAGPKPKPDFGAPRPSDRDSAVIVEPALPSVVTMAIVRPWEPKNDTIVYNQRLMRDALAFRLINRRLESRARTGGSFLQASVDRDDVSRSVDVTSVSILPLGDDWLKAVRDVRTVIAEAMAIPPTQDEIDREVAEFEASLAVSVESSRSEAGAKLADDIVNAVDIRETVASPQVALDVFRGMKAQFTPAAALESTRRLFTGVDTRALLSIPKPIPGAEAQLATALAEPIAVDTKARTAQAAIGFDRLPQLGAPATVVKRERNADVGVEFVELSNGVRLILFQTTSEAGKVLVTARFGGGVASLPRDRPTPAWAAPFALVSSGVGDLGQEELDRLTSGRRINIGFQADDDAFELRAVTRPADLKDQLTLLAAKLGHPGWDPNPVVRARAAALASDESSSASPLGVIGRDLPGLLRAGDPRWAVPDHAQLAALDPTAFRALWEPILASGPIELLIFGDMDSDKAIADAAATFGALPPRPVSTAPIAPATFPAHTAAPIERTHNGPADQAAAVIAWPTAGGLDDLYESRKLEVLAAIFSDRLFERLRQAEGASYSPSVSSSWPTAMTSGGYVLAVSALKPESIEAFYRLANEIAADLATNPIGADELQRNLLPIEQYVSRASTGNGFWLDRLSGASRDPRYVKSLITLASDLRRITPEDLRASAKRWLDPTKSWSMTVRPKPGAPAG